MSEVRCGRVASCRQGSRPHQAGLFLSSIGMGTSRRAWWQGGTGSTMGWTLQTHLHLCAHTKQCA